MLHSDCPEADDAGERPAVATALVRVLIADDDPLVRRALRQALEEDGAFTVEAEAEAGATAVELAVALVPDLVLLDVDMPDLDGITATLRIRRLAPDVRVVMLCTADDEELGMLGLRAGASGFLTKDVTDAALRRALVGVARGEAAVSRALTLTLVDRLRRAPERATGLRPVSSALTAREWQVLDLMAAGASTDGIADELVLSVETVRSHVKHILAKLGAHTRAEAVRAAARMRSPDLAAADRPRDAAELDELAFRRMLERVRERRRD
jgi:DNA-binding NarL/FixJ family response regulator